MTYKEAADRIEKHAQIHYKSEYPHAIAVTEALYMAVNVLRERAMLEDCSEQFKVGNSIWYVDFDTGTVEEGKIFDIQYNNGHIGSFSVEFKETGDFDEFYGDGIGRYFFPSADMANVALRSVRNI